MGRIHFLLKAWYAVQKHTLNNSYQNHDFLLRAVLKPTTGKQQFMASIHHLQLDHFGNVRQTGGAHLTSEP